MATKKTSRKLGPLRGKIDVKDGAFPPAMLPIAWTGMLMDVGDSSGDAMLELPDDLLAQLNWQIDDELNVSMNTRGELVLTKYIA